MAVAVYFDSVFDNSAGAFPAPASIPSLDHDTLMELEFSDIGRDPRFLPGWYILPSVLGALLVLTSLIV
jgi:hypothetical protein